MKNIKGKSARRKKLQRSSVATFDEADIMLKRLMVPTDDETAVTQKVRQRMNKLNSDRNQTTRIEMSDIVDEPLMPPSYIPGSYVPTVISVSKFPKIPGSHGIRRQRVLQSCSFQGKNSKRYGCIRYPWWSDDNIHTYVELISAEDVEDELPSRTKNAKTIVRSPEYHNLIIPHENRHLCSKMLDKRKTKIEPALGSRKSIVHRNHVLQVPDSFDAGCKDDDLQPTKPPAPHRRPVRIVRI
ncbi:unnamed protein product [Aphis gossypii]|uniref:Uncharacterized protein n=1 Tax=Aphis gossypii TaxID=80765 RepID=A0A9P0NFC7_APHGO|nr:unnamed protein product [Aphis gossypii]